MDKGESLKRSANFSTNEISTLMEVVDKHRNTSKCKRTGRVGGSLNINKWKDIEKDFNAQSGELYRPYMVLKKKYQNLKNQLKRRAAKNKQKAKASGTATGAVDESQGTSSVSDFDHQLRTIMGPQLAALNAANPLNINDMLQLNDPKIEDEEETSADFSQVPMSIPMPLPLWEQFNPSFLWEEYSKLKTNKTRRKNGQTNDEDAIAKRKADESMKLLRAEHKLKMEILKTEHEQKMTMMKAEHELKMKLLEAQLEANKKQLSIYLLGFTCFIMHNFWFWRDTAPMEYGQAHLP